ncbi:unannotated protein [freshwater metagenome]|uniref:Unannotated protein n=1 Tax=freshwater metagenome TaxID=449393 RepID=A0A6J6FVZ8_9ZZZZ
MLIYAVGIVHRWRAIERQTYQHLFRCEKLTPLVVEQSPVGLQREFEESLWPGDFPRFRNKSSIELNTHEGGLTTLKGNSDFASAVCLDELGQVGRDEIVRHSKAIARIQLFL